MMMESASIQRLKLDFRGNDKADVIYTVRYTKPNGVARARITKIEDIEQNLWRGTGKAGRIYGREANFRVKNAEEIYKILYDVNVRGGE